jgi:hypothetical protein
MPAFVRPHRVILVSQGRTEERHDAIAHDMIDRALVAMHGFHHPFKDGIEKSACFFRVAISEQLH